MMVKSHSQFICQQCGYSQVGWSGKCPECGSWNSLVETIAQRSSNKEQRKSGKTAEPISLASVSSKATSRISTKITELDRVLGGGLVPGQVTLIAGEPGIGKSTLLLQVADMLSKEHDGSSKLGDEVGSKKSEVRTSNFNLRSSVFYVSGEESVSQIKIRADRLGVKSKSIQLLEETDIDAVIEEVSQVPQVPKVPREEKQKKVRDTFDTFDTHGTFLIVDSIQTMTTSDLSGMAGSVGQVRECAYRLVRFAKENNIPVFLVGHVTKQGSVAGPAVLMHIVDTVLWFEGDKTLTTRMLRAVKNRFGPTDEVVIFEMEEKGLISVDDPEKLFLTAYKKATPGSALTSILQGTRPLLTEIQSLVVPTKMAFPKRIAQGIDIRRFELLLAVLQRRSSLPLYEFDCFVNVAGGISVKNDPSADLAVCLSVASAYFDKPLPKGSIAIGEVGLLGDVREVVAQEKRVKEARRLGYRTIISSKEIRYLGEAIRKYLR